ncbi:hypothetical protein [Streptosporangium minutum]|uniref:Scaffolding protein n=1 Tax=Streptosporangium minutum TaxID=569862 RepID=A0A243RVV9_9ACTN|nr:hypothetical protein [Streptosporangium minutum]OUC99324.1 hypothetical protein CA984_03705 [Streptosporangium minutum]
MPHPLPTAPGALLGYRKTGQPIYLQAGGSGDGDAGDGTQQDSQDTGQQSPATQGQQGSSQDGQHGSEGDVASLPDFAQKLIRDLRTEAASSRTNAKTQAAEQARQDLAQQIGKALGLVKDGDQPADPAQLAQQIGDLSGQNKSLTVELAVYKAAAKVGADAGKLTDSRAFLAQLDKLDPTADGFDAKLRDAIKKAVEDNPQYRTDGQAPAPRGGSEPPGRPGTAGKAANLTDAITAKLAKSSG